MVKCSFCGYDVPRGQGMIYVRKDGSRLDFCSAKCERNMLMSRKPRKIRWTQEFKAFKGEKNDRKNSSVA